MFVKIFFIKNKIMQYLVFLLCIAISQLLYAQVGIDASFNKSQTGWSYRGGVSYQFSNRFTLRGGVKVIQWMGIIDTRGHFFKNRFRPSNATERLGAYLSIDYVPFRFPKGNIEPYLSYDASLSRSSLYQKSYYWAGQGIKEGTTDTLDLYYTKSAWLGPILAVEQHFCVGFRGNINKRWYINQKIGGGIALYKNTGKSIIVGEDWELAWMFSLGLGYRFVKE